MSVTTTASHHVETVVELLEGWAEYGRTLGVETGDTLTVNSGETFTVSQGETSDEYATVMNAGSVETAGTLALDEGEKYTVPKGEIERYATVTNGGTIEVAGTLDSGSNPWATVPTIHKYWDHAQSERGPGAGQPPILYVWSPTGSTLDRFSMDGDEFDRSDTVEVQAWSLDETEVEQLQSDVVQILSTYLDDNTVKTPYTDVAPTGTEDFRAQTPARQTDHYIMSVEISTRGLPDTRITQ